MVLVTVVRGNHTFEFAVDDATTLKQLLETMTRIDGFDAQLPPPWDFLFEVGGDEVFSFDGLCAELGIGSEDMCVGEIPTFRLVCKAPPMPELIMGMKVYWSDDSLAGDVLVHGQASSKQVVDALTHLFDGPVAACRLQFPGKAVGQWRDLPGAFAVGDDDSPLLDRIRLRIEGMSALLRPPIPEPVSNLRVLLVEGCTAVVEPADPAGDAALAEQVKQQEYHATKLACLEKTILTSRSGRDGCRVWMSRLCADVLVFSQEALGKTSTTGFYHCSLCDVTNRIDDAFAGPLRHCGGTAHIRESCRALVYYLLVYWIATYYCLVPGRKMAGHCRGDGVCG